MSMRSTLGLTCAAAIVALSAATAAAQSGDKKAPGEAPPLKKLTNPEPTPRRGFNVVLLLGDMQGADGQDSIPVAARKALADMRDFLPFKNYRLLDTQWIIGALGGAAVTRMRGVDDQEYELELRASQTFDTRGALSPTASSVRFVLRDGSDPYFAAGESGRMPLHPKELAKADTATLDISREIFQLERERDDLQPRVSTGREKVEVGTENADEVRRLETQLRAVTRRISDLKQSLSAASSKAAGRTVIDTSFRMEEGETVVVGTSKVKGGGKALIALLTATTDRRKSSTK